jgi:hypothetical protein
MNNLLKDQTVLFIVRVKIGDENDLDFISDYITLGKLFKINNSTYDLNKLLETFTSLLNNNEVTTIFNVPL